ncbi:hypothetical protein HanRHA438_Chr13g0581911 [Helianthus annuus]|nr:hypothetical protein HanIR_Chr13g0621521 [Helianthus annuus]KAJ0856742.1 hypothetical protein HanRHA438_Chr13g0581911 [Helianthus annuus]
MRRFRTFRNDFVRRKHLFFVIISDVDVSKFSSKRRFSREDRHIHRRRLLKLQRHRLRYDRNITGASLLLIRSRNRRN